MKNAVALSALILAVVGFAWTGPKSAHAVPSFARQTDRACNSCHSMWPGQLRKTGRDFKFTNYQDLAPEYPGGEINRDGLQLLRVMPVSARIIAFPWYQNTKGPGNPKSEIHEVELFVAGRVAPGLGAFVEAEYEDEFTIPIVRVAFKGPGGGDAFKSGFVLGKMEAGGADPYNTLRKNTRLTRTKPEGLRSGEISLWDSNNFGAVAHAYLFDKLYLAAGPFRGSTSGRSAADKGLDMFARAAIEYPISMGDETTVMAGFFLYTGEEKGREAKSKDEEGKEVTVKYDTGVSRLGPDVQIQHFSGPHGLQLLGALNLAKDDNLKGKGQEVSHTGFYTELSYLYDWKYGVALRLDSVSSGDDESMDKRLITFRPTYFFSQNVKLALEMEQWSKSGAKTGSEASRGKSRISAILDFAF